MLGRVVLTGSLHNNVVFEGCVNRFAAQQCCFREGCVNRFAAQQCCFREVIVLTGSLHNNVVLGRVVLTGALRCKTMLF